MTSQIQTAARSTNTDAPSLGQRLKIRSMVTMAGEVLPFFWPMRNFIHHNPLHGLEHLPFEQAVAEASRLFHARGWLPRTEYQRMLAAGDIDLAVLEALVSEQVDAWLAAHGDQVPVRDSAKEDAEKDAKEGNEKSNAAIAQEGALLKRLLMAMLTELDQPAPGDRAPSAAEVLACLREPTS
jgi:uncharacterized protein YbcC (UPF0753/DUF2309 family)